MGLVFFFRSATSALSFFTVVVGKDMRQKSPPNLVPICTDRAHLEPQVSQGFGSCRSPSHWMGCENTSLSSHIS